MKPPTNSTTVDPQWERRVRESFLRQGLMKRYREELTQQHGYFHAGVSASIADSASGYAAYSVMPADYSVLTVEYKINLMAPAAGEMLIARARVVRSGKTLKICAADVFTVKDGVENLCATSLSTIMALAGKPDTRAARKP
jgi:uncharacterized protein (TIGR00369 family)